METRRVPMFAVILLAAALAAGRAAADLPVVEPPAEPGEQADPLPLPRPNANARGDGGDNTADQADGGDQAAPKADAEPIDLDILMKHVTDTRRPIALAWHDRLREVADFQKLSFEQQNKAAPELLALLRNRTPLKYHVVLPDVPPMEVRHRAQAALAQMLSVSLGDFSAAPAETPGDGAAGGDGAGDLAATWAALWNRIADLDEAERREAIGSVRNEKIASADLPVAEANLSFVAREHDTSALPALQKRLDEIPSDDPEVAGFHQQVIGVFSDLCCRPDAPRGSRMDLLDLVRRLNTPDNARTGRMLFMAGHAMHRLTGVAVQTELAAAGDDSNGQQLQLITKDCIDAWIKALQEADKKAAEEQAGGAPQAEGGGS